MRNSRTKLLIKLLIVFISVFAFTIAGHGVYYICEQNNYDGCYQYKLKLLREVPNGTQKAVFIGGSGTNFGVSAETFEEATGIRSINMGFSAGRSFDMYLESVRPYLNNGDYLFLSPELGYYSGEFHTIDKESMMFYEYQNRDSLRLLSFSDFVNYCKYSIENGWTGWFNSLSFGSKTFIQDVLKLRGYSIYDKWECNANGDFTLHRNEEPVDFSTSKSNFPGITTSSFIGGLNEYMCSLKKEVGVQSYIIFPPLDEDSVQDINQIDGFVDSIDKLVNVDLLFSLKDSIYPHSYFFDTHLHLQYKYSKDVYTKLIIEKFQNRFQ